MGWLSPHERRMRLLGRLRMTILVLLGYIVASLIDPWALRVARTDDLFALESRWGYQFLRGVGWAVPWLVAGVVLLARDAVRPPSREVRWNHLRGINLAMAPVLGGLGAELLKRVVARERPLPDPGAYSHKGLLLGFTDDIDLGWPSSHAAVAFAGATMVRILRPSLGPVAVFLAVGCGWTRVSSGAHFLSDVYAGCVVGYCCAMAIRPLRLRPRPLPLSIR